MKLAIMQPYFFPYLEYFSLIKKTDRFVLLDTVQFIRHGWIERNRILKPAHGWQYISVPLKKRSASTLIGEIAIRNAEDWRAKLLRQLEHYEKRAPFYDQTMSLVQRALEIQTGSIVKLNANVLRAACAYLGVRLNLDVYSEMNLVIEDVIHPDEWALNISKALDAAEYVNPPGGTALFRRAKFERAGISLRFLANNLTRYSQRRPVFEPGLSIIDVMMFNDVDSVNKLIDDVRYVE